MNNDSIKKILKFVNLDGYQKHICNHLSSGEKKKVAIANIISKNPKVVLVNDSIFSLDLKNKVSIMQIFESLSKDRLVIVSSFDEDIIKNYADRIIKISDEKIVSDELQERSNTNEDTISLTDLKLCVRKSTSNKQLFKEGVKYNLRSIVKVFFIFLSLTLFTISLFLAIVIQSTSKGEVMYNTLTKNNINYVTVTKGQMSEEKGYLYEYKKPLTLTEVNQFSNTLSNFSQIVVSKQLSSSINANNKYFPYDFAYANNFNLNEFDIIKGKITEVNNEAIISKEFADNLIFRQQNGSYDTLIGEEIKIKAQDNLTSDKAIICGIYDNSNLNNHIFITSAYFKDLSRMVKNEFASHIEVQLSENHSKNIDLLNKYLFDINKLASGKSKIVITTLYSDTFHLSVGNNIDSLISLFWIMKVVFIIFMFFIYKKITGFSQLNERKNNILKSMGATTQELKKIYYFQYSIYLAVLPVSIVLGVFIINYFKDYFKREYSDLFVLYSVNSIHIVFTIIIFMGIFFLTMKFLSKRLDKNQIKLFQMT